MARQPRYTPLKLIALSEADLQVISGLLQDAVILAADMHFDPEARRFVVMTSRYIWEKPRFWQRPRGLRVRAALRFNHVEAVRFQGFDPGASDQVLALLALTAGVADGDARAQLTLTFSGGAAIQLDADAVDAVLTDIGDPWDAARRPRHD